MLEAILKSGHVLPIPSANLSIIIRIFPFFHQFILYICIEVEPTAKTGKQKTTLSEISESMKINIHPSRHDIMVSIGFLIVVGLLAAVGWGAWRHFKTSPPYIDPERYPVMGIDISSHNGMMNLDAAADAGIRFVFIKASEGVDFRDSNFRINYNKARHAGMKIGAYHFFRFDKDGIEQARNFVHAIGNRRLDLGVAIDVESHGNPVGIDSTLIAKRLTDMADFLNLVGYRVTFYSNRDGYLDYLQKTVPGSTLWICSFSPNPNSLEWTFWQFNHRGKIAGIRGDVDLNVFCGGLEEWENFLAGSTWPYSQPPYSPKAGQPRNYMNPASVSDYTPEYEIPTDTISYIADSIRAFSEADTHPAKPQ